MLNEKIPVSKYHKKINCNYVKVGQNDGKIVGKYFPFQC